MAETPKGQGSSDSQAETRSVIEPGPTSLTEIPSTQPPDASSRDSSMMIGDYRILRKLGSGGMGIVYEAEQQHPKRLVALKVIKGGRFVDDSHVKLFEREAQALARLKHPGIAAIYESGRTEEGQHFFAMELVRGETLKEYLEKSLSGGPMTPVQLRECLAIFRKIADAVTYAHQRGVIHRDLKPPNIIVLREFEPSGSESEPQTPAIKILDFGLARITETDLAVTTIGTELGAIQGTLPYMSPEQVRGNPDEIDVRSDVYSLGVILYEMIAGKRPYNVQNAMLHEAARIICEVPPDPLSKSWSGTKRLDKDLETIVGKALEKKAPLRYQNVSAFGEDVSRFLAGQPILARPPSAMYQLRKMALRHKLGFAFAASLLVLIAAFSIGMSIQARRIARERDRANQEAETSKQLSEFLVGLFTVSDPGEARGNSVTAREILDKGAQKIEGELGDRPIPKAEMMRTIGGVYTSLGLYKQAQPLLEKSLAITRTAASSTPLAKSNSLLQLAILYDTQGRFTEALPLAQESLLIREKALGPEHLDAARALLEVGIIHRKTGKYADAKRCLERSLAIREKALGPEHVEVMDALSHLGWLYTLMRNYPEATRCYERVLAVREKLGPDQPEVAMALSDLGLVRVDMGDYDAALKFLQRALAIREKVLGPNHYEVANTVDGIGTVFWYQGKLQEARPYYERALEIREKAFGPEHFHVAGSLHNLALLLSTMGEEEKSRPLDERALAIEEKVFGPENPNLAQGFYNLAILLSRLGEYSEARRLLGRALEISEKAYGPENAQIANILNSLGYLCREDGQYGKALSFYERALRINEKALGDQHPDVAWISENLASFYGESGNYEKALALYKRALRIQEKRGEPQILRVARDLGDIANLHRENGKYEEARGAYERAAAIREKDLTAKEKADGPDDPKVATALMNLAKLHGDNGNYEKARGLYERTLAILEKAQSPRIQETLINLASLHRNHQRHAAALPLYQRALAMQEKKWGPHSWPVAEILVDLGRLEVARGRLSQADSFFKRATAIAQTIQGETSIFSYNQACCSALLKNRDRAIYFLKQAVARGFDAKYKMAHDPDLASLRNDPDFEAIVK